MMLEKDGNQLFGDLDIESREKTTRQMFSSNNETDENTLNSNNEWFEWLSGNGKKGKPAIKIKERLTINRSRSQLRAVLNERPEPDTGHQRSGAQKKGVLNGE